MGAKTILFILIFFKGLDSAGQERLITCNTQTNPDKTVSIYANSQAYGEYTLKLSFTSLSGFTSSKWLSTPEMTLVPVTRGISEVAKFTREKNSFGNPSLQYKYSYFPGRVFRKTPDTAFEYLLPARAGDQLRVGIISSTVSSMSQQLRSEYRGTGFSYKLYDTICAARAGIVYECSDTAREGEKAEMVFRRGRNRVQVQQRDGTIGNYGVTAPIKLLVSPGDEVYPGQPLAVFDKEADKYRLYFSVCYLDEGKLTSGSSFDNTGYYVYVSTRFYGNADDRSTLLQVNKEYTAQHPKEIIAAEMTKKEKKKLGY